MARRFSKTPVNMETKVMLDTRVSPPMIVTRKEIAIMSVPIRNSTPTKGAIIMPATDAQAVPIPKVTVQPLLPIFLIFSAPAMLRALRRHSHGRK
jgi:hypothetical protein